MRLGWRPVDTAIAGLIAAICVAMTVAFWLLLTPFGGTYTSAAYHFRITYPNGWKISVNTGDVPSVWTTQTPGAQSATPTSSQITPVPLLLTITRSSAHTSTPNSASTLTVTVLDLRAPYIAKQANGLASNPSLHPYALSGLAGYATAPIQQQLPGPNGTAGTATDTHTDYYVVHSGYEYQISTDVVSGDDGANQALQSMLRSFTVTG
jgi:hypothetical protein